jgi:hypothetical protein
MTRVELLSGGFERCVLCRDVVCAALYWLRRKLFCWSVDIRLKPVCPCPDVSLWGSARMRMFNVIRISPGVLLTCLPTHIPSASMLTPPFTLCRAIGMFRTSYSFVAMSRPNVPDQLALMWYGNYNPAASQYTPLYLASEYLPEAYTRYVRCWGYVMVFVGALCQCTGPV